MKTSVIPPRHNRYSYIDWTMREWVRANLPKRTWDRKRYYAFMRRLSLAFKHQAARKDEKLNYFHWVLAEYPLDKVPASISKEDVLLPLDVYKVLLSKTYDLSERATCFVDYYRHVVYGSDGKFQYEINQFDLYFSITPLINAYHSKTKLRSSTKEYVTACKNLAARKGALEYLVPDIEHKYRKAFLPIYYAKCRDLLQEFHDIIKDH